MEFFPSCFQVKDLSTGIRLLQGRTKDDLYEWPLSYPKSSVSYVSYPDTKTTISQWHHRLGHPSASTLKTIVLSFYLPCFNKTSTLSPCNDCLLNKTQKFPFQQSTIVSTHPLEYVFSDVWQSPITSHQNFKYYLILVDHFTWYTWLFHLTMKSQVKEIFSQFTLLAETKFKTKLRHLYYDNGGEFIALCQFLSTHGISHLATLSHTPEHNGLSERKHRHVVDTGLSLLSSANLPLTYWPLAFSSVVFLINRYKPIPKSCPNQYLSLPEIITQPT